MVVMEAGALSGRLDSLGQGPWVGRLLLPPQSLLDVGLRVAAVFVSRVEIWV